jgi:hypothetical protein
MIAEAMAESPAAADAVLAVCRRWAAEESGARPEPVKRVILALPPEGPIAAAAMHQRANFERHYPRCGGSMARVLNVKRLLGALKPELAARLRAAGSRSAGSLRIQTDFAEAALLTAPDGITVGEAQAGSKPAWPPSQARTPSGDADEEVVIHLPQQTLARLALGAFPPGDLLARLEEPMDERARQLVEILFPLRHPHMYLPDRF